MSLPRYAEYKDSGVEWLGEIPAHWQTPRLKTILRETDERTGERDAELLGLSKSLGVVKRTELEQGAAVSDDYSKYKLVLPGQLVMNKMQAWNGVFGLARNFGKVSPDYATFEFLKPEVNQYMNELFRTDIMAGVFFTRCRGMRTAFLRINSGDFLDIKIPLPPLAEVLAIATFLDRETAKIDGLIAEQEKLIALLAEKRQATISHAVTKGLNPAAPMKDSGVAWLAEVPAHWAIIRLGGLFKEVSEPGNDDLPLLSVSIHDGVSDKELDENEMDRKVTRSDDRSKYKAVAPGDLTYNMMRAWQGGFGTVTVPGMVSPAYVVARPLREFSTSIIEQQLRTPQAVSEMKRHSRGITDFRLRLYWEEFKIIFVTLPPAAEQASIATFIDREIKKIDALAVEATRGIALLKERRSGPPHSE